MTLMYCPDSTLLTADELSAVPTPAPLGPRHRPVGFGQYVNLVKHRLDLNGIEVANEEYVLTPDGQSFHGQMRIITENFQRDDVDLVIGLGGSHNMRYPRTLAIGTHVIVCQNGMTVGDLVDFSTKQTTNVWGRLPLMVDEAIEKIPAAAQRENDRIGNYKLHRVGPRVGDAALVELMRQGALSGAQLTRAIREWDTPAFEAHAEDGFTAWRLLNAVTEVQKPTGTQASNPAIVAQRTATAVQWIDANLMEAA